MEHLTSEFTPIVVLMALMAVPFVLAVIWVAYKRRSERRAREAMKRGNEIYREWRADTVRQPLE
jgi:hypothetical protein